MADGERASIPIRAGTIAGIAAWLAGYLITYAGTVDTGGWRVVGWLYYNAHGVDVRFPRTDEFRSVGANRNYIAAADGDLWVLYFLPLVVLLLAGAIVAWRGRTVYRQRTDAAIVGSTVTAGYLLCSVVGIVAFAVGVDGESIRPDPITATVLAGIAYPFVFGAAGGIIASRMAARAARVETSSTER